MNFINRAWLYIIRKKTKTFLLFIIFFFIALFVLSALAIGNASELAQNNLRKSLGGEFTLGYNYSENNPYLKITAVEGGTIIYSTQQISPNLIDEIKKIEGVENCSATTENLPTIPSFDFFPGTIPLEEEFRQSTKMLGVWKSEENKYFTTGKIKLIEGHHINPQDKNKVIISEDLAKRNKLKVGDYFKTDKGLNLQIIGLFSPKEVEKFNEQVTAYDKIQNLMIADLSTMIEIENSPATQGFNELNVTVSDPQNIDKIISNITNIELVDWNGFEFIINTENYDNTTGSLQQISNLVTTFLIIVLIVSVVILSLILTMWSRTRIHETGVLLSLGISKISIVSQYVVESLIIAVLAFSLSYFPSSIVANEVGQFLQSNSEKNEQIVTKEGYEVTERNEAYTNNSNLSETQLDIQVNSEELVLLFTLGISVVIISSGISCITIMRFKPKEILSKMS